MRVQMTKHIGGYRNGEEWPDIDGIIDVPDHEAVDLIANGYAKEADDADRPDQEVVTDSNEASPAEGTDGAAGNQPATGEVTEPAKPTPKKTAAKKQP